MALFSTKDRCPACGARKAKREEILWVCTACEGHGPILSGSLIYQGIHGSVRRREAVVNNDVTPTVLAQLARVAPELRAAAGDSDVATAFNVGAFNIAFMFEGTLSTLMTQT